jgi:hypothetical protein
MNLQEWRRIGFQLAADLQTLGLEARRLGLADLEAEAQALRARVEDRRFTVAVVGDFRRGKSTFLNALIGRAVLPSDIAPTTATVNRITYGVRPSAELRFRDGRPPESIPIEALAEHVTKLTDTAAGRAAAIREAVVTCPVRFCRNDVDLLDTPGLGDEATMTEVTLRQLPMVDAAILVIMADSPFSETEAEFLDRLYAEGVTELLFVVSALDRIRRPADRVRVLDNIRERIAKRIESIAARLHTPGSPEHVAFLQRRGEPRVFGVSALLALEGREIEGPDGAALVESSGMPVFEAALERFLTSADEVGLKRRLEQAGALCRTYLDAPAPAQAVDTVGPELERLSALLEALSGALERSDGKSRDAAARVAVALEAPVGQLDPKVRQQLANLLQRCDVTPAWPAAYAGFTVQVTQQMVEVIRACARDLGPEVEQRLSGAHAEDEALPEAARYLMRHVADQLSALGHTLSTSESSRPTTIEPVFDLDGFVAAVTPDAGLLYSALNDAAVSAALTQVSKRSAFEAFMALDFGGVQARWVAEVGPRVAAVLDSWWGAHKPVDAMRERVESWRRARRALLEPVQLEIRAMQAELVACRERASAARDRLRHERTAGAQTVEELRGRMAKAAANLV